MDYDVLLRIARSAIKGILSQDTTDYWEQLDNNVVLICNPTPQAGDLRAAVMKLAELWDDSIELKRRQLETSVAANKTLLNAEREAEEKKIQQMVNRPKIELHDLGGLGVELARGAESVGRATLSVFEWMHKNAKTTSGVAQPQSKQEVRRRKDGASKAGGGADGGAGGGGGGGSSSLYLSPNRQKKMREDAIKAQEEAAAAGRTLEGKLGFSSISLTYGLPHALVRDELYVHEEGKVALIVRTALPPDEGYLPDIVRLRDAAVMDASGGQKKRSGFGGTTAAGGSESPRSGRSQSPRSTTLPAAASMSGSGSARGASPRSTTYAAGAAASSSSSSMAAAGGGGGGKQQQQQQRKGDRGISPHGQTITSNASTTATATTSNVGCSRVLDFSFKKVESPYDLLRIEPTHYIRHLPAPVAKEAPKNLADEVRANRAQQQQGASGSQQQSGGLDSKGKSFITIQAKRRDGEVEKYGFSAGSKDHDNALSLSDNGSKKSTVDPELEQLVSGLRTRVVCDSVRLCNNELRDATQLLPVLRNLVVNHYLRIQWLDLSNNRLTAVPPEISQMPLQALHLHGNEIVSWKSLEAELPKLTRLQHFTVFGNAIAEDASKFRPRALGMLLHVPHKMLPFKSLDFVPLTLVDVQSAAAFLRTNPKALEITVPKKKPSKAAVGANATGKPANYAQSLVNSVY